MIRHHRTCKANYPEKPRGEPPQHIVQIDIDEDTVVFQCSDCGAYEMVRRCAQEEAQ